MKRIIELPDDVVKAIQNEEDYRYDIHTAIAQSTPYNPSGDLISREALKKAIIELNLDNTSHWSVIHKINNAPTVPLPNEQIAWEQGYEAGLAQGKHDRPQGEWKHIGGDEWVCSECGHVITTEGSWENPLSTGAYHCENCGADMRGDNNG